MSTPVTGSTSSSAPEHGERGELALPGLLLGGAVVVAAFAALTTAMSAVSSGGVLPAYPDWLRSVATDAGARVQWVLGDITEPQFYKSWVATLGLLAGATVGWWAHRTRKRWAGEPIAYGSGLWPWMLGAAGLSLVMSNLVVGDRLALGWQPTFVPFVCVAPAMVLVYGRGWSTLVTGAVLGVMTTPLAMLLIATVTGPLELPAVVANTASMSIGTALAFLLVRPMPWMRLPVAEPDSQEETAAAARRAPTVVSDAVWMVRRVVTDFTETQFYANEWASLGLIAGAVLTTLLGPDLGSYGTGLLPRIMLAQALTSTIGIILWRHLYRGGGWAPTYISVVSVAPATVLAHGDSLTALLLGAVAGAVLCPLVARPVSARLPQDFHPFIGNTVAMAVVTSMVVPVIGLLV
ncbi:hypothetical protein [Janibacter melonis]|uniref:hypothetical protein n=1 Tax=Janibacter melonis TaxID=262209 RepID=UPI0017498EAA|nr:hypothetical protein [Janibacter melonis]